MVSVFPFTVAAAGFPASCAIVADVKTAKITNTWELRAANSRVLKGHGGAPSATRVIEEIRESRALAPERIPMGTGVSIGAEEQSSLSAPAALNHDFVSFRIVEMLN
jgi:hypothetical protein